MTLPALIEQMLRPEFYPHPVRMPISLLQTHISYVLLTGDYAYKVKKPMNFGFLDFSTLEKRHFFCQEEVRLNQRLATSLYLGVCGIGQDAQGAYFLVPKVGEGQDSPEVVEYAVQMVEFDQAQLLIHLFEAGALGYGEVREIGMQLAAFHQQALTNEHIASFGTAAGLKAVCDDNYAQTKKYVGITQTESQLGETQEFSNRVFVEQADLFARRVREGRIRECHGDLHLKNICLHRGLVQIFDCIEFNEPFRNTDVLYDAAFLLMDLQFRDRRDLGNEFLNTYLEQTGDYGGAVLLPLFLSMRAYVRAKVTSFLLDDPNVPVEVRSAAITEAIAYFRLAWQYTRLPSGRIIVMSGVSGTGKSTLGRQLSRVLEAIQIRSDAVRKHLAGLPLRSRGDTALYSPTMTEKTYDQVLSYGVTLARAGFTVILDAKYDRVARRAAVLAAAADLPVTIIYCHAPTTVLQERLVARAATDEDVADATVDLLQRQQELFEDFTELERSHLVRVDTTAVDLTALVTQLVGG
ncbi:MAG: AAA family ATPase [Oscillatoriales cyanobacterium SM2_2_1]|nr:AAA family ATPase [Oscillatoriales cyanobacterium SM2_2_1]